MALKVTAPAKVNLHLKVFGKRPDGFHEMQTLMLKIGFYDELEMSVEEGEGVRVIVKDRPELSNDDNLVARAARAYLKQAGIEKENSVRFLLHKNIYTAAGLGGGSSDAASTLLALQIHFNALPFEDLLRLGEQLGSDVPLFLYESPLAFGYGRGEKIQLIQPPPKKMFLVLVSPGFGLSTPEIYQKLGRPLLGEFMPQPSRAEARTFQTWGEVREAYPFENDLQAVVEKEFPDVTKIILELRKRGAWHAMMSGSGSTVFGMFHEPEHAMVTAEGMKNEGFRAVFAGSL